MLFNNVFLNSRIAFYWTSIAYSQDKHTSFQAVMPTGNSAQGLCKCAVLFLEDLFYPGSRSYVFSRQFAPRVIGKEGGIYGMRGRKIMHLSKILVTPIGDTLYMMLQGEPRAGALWRMCSNTVVLCWPPTSKSQQGLQTAPPLQ